MKLQKMVLGLATLALSLNGFAADLTRVEIEQKLKSADKTHIADLRRKDFRNLDLSKLDFRNADLWGTDLRDANLNDSDLSNLNLDLTVMTRIHFARANLSNTSIFGVSMMDADLSGAKLLRQAFEVAYLTVFPACNLNGIIEVGAGTNWAIAGSNEAGISHLNFP
ncbi:MAG: pentapeptide repeat-containing protein [Methylococcales bacterium]